MRARLKDQVVRIEDEDDLSGVRGYKKREDGTTTTYFDREVDSETKRMLDQAKAPKRLSVGEGAQTAGAPSGAQPLGSAWNGGGTWEERDLSTWANAEIKSALDGLSAELPADFSAAVDGISADAKAIGAGGGDLSSNEALLDALHLAQPIGAKVKEVKSVEGSAAVTCSRGALRHSLDYAFAVRAELTVPGADDGASATYIAKLEYSDVAAAGSKPVSYELKRSYESAVPRRHELRVSRAVDQLDAEVRHNY